MDEPTSIPHDGPSILQRLIDWLDAFALFLSWIGMWVFVPLLGVLVCYGVAMRYVFDVSFNEGPEAEQFLLLLIFLTGLPYCTAKRNHIVLHIIYDRLGRRGKVFCDLLGGLFGGIFFGLLAWRAFAQVPNMIRYQDAGQFLQVPKWPLELVMLLCAAVVALQFPLMALHSAFHRDEPPREGHS